MPKRGEKKEQEPAASTPVAAGGRFRDRIIGLQRVRASELKRNPKNFRRHDDEQRGAMEGVLEEVGFAGAALAYRNDDGELELFDGHLRADVADDDVIPVLETDLTPAEASKMLAVYDMIGGMADIDGLALEALLGGVEFDSREVEAALDVMLKENLPRDAGVSNASSGEAGGRRKRGDGDGDDDDGPVLQMFPNEQYDYVLVLARTRSDTLKLFERLGVEKVRVPRSRRVGLGRCIDARVLLRALGEQV